MAGLLVVALLYDPVPARADWLAVPFVGMIFGGDTNVVLLADGARAKKFTFGGSFLALSDGLFGVEAEFAHTPHFFESGTNSLAIDSNVTTLTGNVVAAVPLAVTRESLRPYVVAGVGLMHASSDYSYDVLSFDTNLLGLNLGGGAIGFVSQRTGIRFDLRHFRNLTPDRSATTTDGSTRLSFWRASVGLVIRY